VKKGAVSVGIFGVTSEKVDLGVSRDSLMVEEPAAAATRTVAELRKKGATVIIALAQLGKVESEDMATAVDGIDAVVVGRNVPMLQKGRTLKNTVLCYGGEQGQYVGRTLMSLDAAHKMTTAENECFLLSPDVGEKQEVLALVKSFEDSFNDKLRKKEKEQAAQAEATRASSGASAEQAVEHYVGADVCARCHKPEYDQWLTTKHAGAWKTLVDNKKDANTDCIPCHVLGYKQPGGWEKPDDAARLSNVQCENCHGMGTQHESFPAQAHKLTEATCRNCHNATTSPEFDFALFEPHIVHKGSGELKPLPATPMKDKMAGAH
jgi:hypothetical protein